jgi:DNA (cytosine-5)-methyltransferase 1
MLKVMDLFSGIGGFSLGLERTGGFETVAFCEIDPFCCKVLNKHWPDVPIYNDVRTLEHDGSVDVITGGYPCQPFSTAGNRKGATDDRHLWPFMFSLIKKHRPAWVIGENVAGHISMGLDGVLADLESAIYTVRTFVIPACALDAKHRRDRTWIVAHTESTNDCGETRGFCKKNGRSELDMLSESSGSSTSSEISPNPTSIRSPGSRKDNGPINTEADKNWKTDFPFANEGHKWPVEPTMDRVVNGVSDELDECIKALGNAVVPQIPEMIGYAILEAQSELCNNS